MKKMGKPLSNLAHKSSNQSGQVQSAPEVSGPLFGAAHSYLAEHLPHAKHGFKPLSEVGPQKPEKDEDE